MKLLPLNSPLGLDTARRALHDGAPCVALHPERIYEDAVVLGHVPRLLDFETEAEPYRYADAAGLGLSAVEATPKGWTIVVPAGLDAALLDLVEVGG